MIKKWFDRYALPDPHLYPAGFISWVLTEDGYRIWRDFETRARTMARRRKRYSAMAICQVIRWDTDLKDGGDFKLDNNWVPGLARLWLHAYGNHHPTFFELRQ